jgi:hypothetical protein
MPRSWAAAQMSSMGGHHPVTLAAAVMARSDGATPSSMPAITSSSVKVPSGPQST